MPDTLKSKSIAVIGNTQSAGGSGSAMGSNIDALIKAQIKKFGGKVATNVSEATIVMNIIRSRHIRRAITLSAVGKSNMYDLNFIVIYQVQDGQGHVIGKERELAIRREYFNTQASPLGQSLEESQYRAEMEQEAAISLTRQLVLIMQHPDKVTQDEADIPKKDNNPQIENNPSTP